MKLLLDDKQHRGCDLNANEACIFAAILKCTRAGRGWYGNYRELAAAMPFVISHVSVFRAVQKLLNLGLIERRDNALFAVLQNETSLLQNETTLLHNETTLLHNETETDSPYNPLINKEIMNENEHATCAQTCDTRTPESPSFDDFLRAFGRGHTSITRDSAEMKWNQCSEAKKHALLAALKAGTWDKPRPDWCIEDFPEPTPDFLRGDESGDIVQVKYNGAYKLCHRETMELFGLEWVRDW